VIGLLNSADILLELHHQVKKNVAFPAKSGVQERASDDGDVIEVRHLPDALTGKGR
jgi:hypothetical protein